MFLGMRGTGDWVTDQRPMNWRQNILYLYPNGMTPLTAFLSMMRSRKVDDPQFHWWTQEMGSVDGDINGIYTTPDLATAYVSGGVAGDVLYVSVSATDGNRIKPSHEILLRDASDYTVDCVGKVIDVVRGAVAVLSVRLLEDDDNSASHDLSDADRFKIIGSINPEGGEMPDPIALNPTKVYNYTQIFRSSLSTTRTALATRLRTENDYQKAKRECLETHSIEMEMAFLWGVKSETTGDNGKPERTTQGIINFIREYAPLNCDDFSLNATYSADTWAASGEIWFKYYLEQIFRYGASEKLAIVGSGALLGIDALAMAGGQINLQPAQKTYGMDIRTWITPFGTIHMKTHPLFSFDATTRNMMVILEPKELEYKFITDTTFYGESSSKSHPEGYGSRRIDGKEEEYLTEAGLEFGLAQKCAVLNGLGVDNVV
jgi:hypothetical protein